MYRKEAKEVKKETKWLGTHLNSYQVSSKYLLNEDKDKHNTWISMKTNIDKI